VKKKSKNWSDIKPAKSLTKAANDIDKKKSEDDENPSANLLGLMKELYDTGDDNIKRTIAESW
jgi:calcyclin binding protein